jgi:hypothetical protein
VQPSEQRLTTGAVVYGGAAASPDCAPVIQPATAASEALAMPLYGDERADAKVRGTHHIMQGGPVLVASVPVWRKQAVTSQSAHVLVSFLQAYMGYSSARHRDGAQVAVGWL